MQVTMPPNLFCVFASVFLFCASNGASIPAKNCVQSWRTIYNTTAERCGDMPRCWASVYNVLEKKKGYDDCLDCLNYIVEGRSGKRPLQANYFVDHYLCMRKRTTREQSQCLGGDEESRSLRPVLHRLLQDFRTSGHDVCNMVAACLPRDQLTLEELTEFRIFFGEYYSPDEPLDLCWPVINHYFHGNRMERSRRGVNRNPFKCSGGTKFWCSSEDMARRCNRYKYCKWKIWDR